MVDFTNRWPAEDTVMTRLLVPDSAADLRRRGFSSWNRRKWAK